MQGFPPAGSLSHQPGKKSPTNYPTCHTQQLQQAAPKQRTPSDPTQPCPPPPSPPLVRSSGWEQRKRGAAVAACRPSCHGRGVCGSRLVPRFPRMSRPGPQRRKTYIKITVMLCADRPRESQVAWLCHPLKDVFFNQNTQ
ncbi:hypothetical protein H112_01267 [Trichophyton rubrum D6]|uniref:Uncharacterized protein n=3 Tax=Trichophyton TaxID=5550 RepID=F2SYM5_TRIRC|nr:uncharacterized protein TERG_07682 [Trichophyton rubrum CBS 118892]EZF26614.1 hypothetical protein H100_01261 [Trichophyton rubrum MR850]EZF45649.1 hypothetical protein H102_01257 [Trichophyton rubrum CBS 100081]EZF56436.1 hypothetical protein H103_01264 [Trichophyton rubrum CBS 288.86]EZF67020.1 hypothetical protein H104_01251 [Trichophyton rubrum CBS 289.86]EZF77562.1 hypothetical protein H105_01271 [Trichophyton soudanense CBS 452.61]EZF88208.1 hypothetical protein H110_01267 [Trichophy